MSTAYQINYRKQVKGQRCACGQPAVGNKCGMFVCATCLRLEERHAYKLHQEREIRARHELQMTQTEEFWARIRGEIKEPPLCTYTRDWLDRMFPETQTA